jgi:predicted DNA binding CopG/RHH family protein
MPNPRKKRSNRVAEPVRRFASEAEESAFWQKSDAAEIDWSRAQRVRLPRLKASTATISLRLPEGMLDELKVLANKRDVPYQSLLKVFLAERLAAERRGRRRAS